MSCKVSSTKLFLSMLFSYIIPVFWSVLISPPLPPPAPPPTAPTSLDLLPSSLVDICNLLTRNFSLFSLIKLNFIFCYIFDNIIHIKTNPFSKAPVAHISQSKKQYQPNNYH